MADEMYRQFNGEIRELKEKNEFLLDVTIALVFDGLTRNNWVFTDMEGNKNKFAGKPILTAYVLGKVGDGHNSTKKIDKNGKEYVSFTGPTDQRIIGSMSDDPDDFWTEVDAAGNTWIVGRGSVWKWYAKEAAEKIEADTKAGKPMSISIEALVERFRMEGDVEIEEAWLPLGITVLGDGVNPAVPGAHIASLSEIASGEFERLRIRAASYKDPKGEKEEPLGESKIKPQKNNTEKESHTLKAFSKKQLAQLSAKFPGYNVIAAGQNDAGIHVCLMAADGGTAVYTMENLEATVAPEKIMRNNAQVSFDFGDDAMAVDCCELTDRLSGSLIEAETKISNLSADLESANNTIKEMNEAEAKRRIKAAKAKALATLDAFNANREEKVEKEVLNSINASIEAGEFSECTDAEGCWNGEQMVEDAVLAKCAKSQMELDKISAQRKNSINVWDNFGSSEGETDGLASLIAKYGK